MFAFLFLFPISYQLCHLCRFMKVLIAPVNIKPNMNACQWLFTLLVLGDGVLGNTTEPPPFKAWAIVPTVFTILCFGCVVGFILLVVCKTNADVAVTNELKTSGLQTVPCVIVRESPRSGASNS